MRKRFTRGLVVGKFAPLHLGHEHVIRRALADCHEVFVISYSKPEMPGCEPDKRAQWLAARFPQVRSLIVTEDLLRARLPGVSLPHNEDEDLVHRQFVALLCRMFLGGAVDVVFTSEDYGDGFASELTKCFRTIDQNAPVVNHILVDRARQRFPISGTELRNDVHGNRRWLSAEVYASFVEQICILGGESSGKSTLAKALASHHETVHVTEYGRDLWIAKDGNLVFDDMLHIAERQIAWEEASKLDANRYVFCDTSPLTTLFYSEDLFSAAAPELNLLARRAYSLAVLCAPDFDFVQDGTRRDPEFRARQHTWYLGQLADSDQPWMVVSGSVCERIHMVVDRLTKWRGQTDSQDESCEV